MCAGFLLERFFWQRLSRKPDRLQTLGAEGDKVLLFLPKI
ncbi:hypothetical protein CLOSTASPAR_01558 [[Clostridium] asparagiforme DSM 15981]|uniref:Uncharacterized protein n=1 Tax=[Clostridium] asparagiforme DSM 15981 TaxID=518636 RepID=C0CX37_9FIRM|nr:hypothetical protein CLOSTASPAR_01558 [[Clostridium] asparagiforme DSM 15981]